MLGLEWAVGLLAAAACAGSVFLFVLTVRAMSQGDDTHKAEHVLAIGVSVAVAVWCGQVAWRLFTRRGRFGTAGLLSPMTYVVFGAGLVVAVVAMLLGKRPAAPGGLAVLLGMAALSFGMASAQRRAEQKARRRTS